MMDGVRPRGIIRMMVPFGSISFATLSANGRDLRTPAIQSGTRNKRTAAWTWCPRDSRWRSACAPSSQGSPHGRWTVKR
jgi:hypothetical protein